MKNRNLLIASIAVLLAVIIFFIIQNREIENIETEEKVRIGYLNIAASLPLFIAENEGLFEKNGIEYESFIFTTSNQLVDALISNNIDVAVELSAVPVIDSEINAPGRIKIFSVSKITKANPFDGIITTEESNIESLNDLEGKIIGVFPGSTAKNLLQRFLSQKGLDINKIQIIPVPPPSMLSSLTSKRIDALHAYEPIITIGLEDLGAKEIYGSVYAEMLSPNPQGISAMTNRYLENRPESAKRVISIFEDAFKFMKTNDEESRKILQDKFELSDSTAKNTHLLYMDIVKMNDEEVLKAYLEILLEIGEIESIIQFKDFTIQDN